MSALNWVLVAWTTAISVSLALSILHGLVWAKDRREWPHLVFVLAAVSAAAVGVFEYLMLSASSAAEYGQAQRWAHVPLAVLVASIVLFVKLYLKAGRTWLAWATVALRALAGLVLNFLMPVNLNFVEISSLRHVQMLGEPISIPVGTPNPWLRVAQLNALLLIAFLVDAGVTVWRRGERLRASLIVGSLLFFSIYTTVQGALLISGRIAAPYVMSLIFLIVQAAMGWELSSDLLRARELVRALEVSEGELSEIRNRLELVSRATSIGMLGWDVGRDGVATVTGSTMDRLLATVHPDDRDRVRSRIEESLRDRCDFECEYRVVLSGGEVRWQIARGEVELDTGGRSTWIRGVSFDITARKNLEAELSQHREELAHLTRVATVGELSGSLAHELNQPLTAILTNAQTAQRLLSCEVPKLGDLREILSDIVEEDRRAGQIIQRLRKLVKKEDVHFERLDVAEVVDDVLQVMRSDLVNKGVTVTVERSPADSSAHVLGDRVQLQQVLLNLIVNGCDAMGEAVPSERRLHVRLERDDGKGVTVSVSDRGPGIPEESLPRIFEPFVTTKPQGLGLGLAVCRTIITAHGGTLRAANNLPDAGATVQFTLPVSEERR